MGLASSLTMGLVSAGVAMAGSMASGLASASQQRTQAENYEQQAKQTREQARLTEQQGAIEAQQIDRRKSKLRRDYEAMQGRNDVSLGAGNVDLASGSAANVAEGNAGLFASDVAENYYDKMLKEYQTAEQAKQQRYQADILASKSNYLEQTANDIGPTLLTTGLSGIQGFMSGYTAAGGKFFGDGDPATQSATDLTIWQKNWDKGGVNTNGEQWMSMRHPSGKLWSSKLKI